MSIRKDLVIKISNGSASLDMPLQIYEKDHGIELRFKLMDYKYKYDKDPDNILNSNKEDILEAYTTIVNPLGYELRQINGEVVEDTVKFMIEDSYTDELEELGIYKLQIHVKCEHSEFSIPPVQFEVLERLKGMPLYAQVDEGVVDYSTTSDETEVIEIVDGKLQLVWQSEEIITSTRLNAMVNYANSLHDEIDELSSEVDTNIANKLQEQDTKLQQLETNINTTMHESISAIEDDIATINAQQATQDQKITNIESNYALKSELEAPAVQVEGSVISCDSTEGYAQNVEVLGNTIQDADNLADIRSVGDDVEGQELYKIDIVSCGKNLFDIEKSVKDTLLNVDTGEFYGISGMYDTSSYIKVYNGKEYQLTNSLGWYYCFYDLDKNFLRRIDFPFAPEQDGYVCISYNQTEKNLIQLEVGTVATDYEPYQEQKLEILSPVQLEKVGDVADRIICKDGVWGVEKNIYTCYLKDCNYIIYNEFAVRTTLSELANTNAERIPAFYSNLEYLHETIHYQWNVRNINSIALTNNTCDITTENFNSADAIKMIKDIDVWVKYELLNSKFIPLPHDQQVKLRTFASKTNISVLTEIEGTIKASIPQSINSTISTHTSQIDNLNKELDRVKKLEESTVSTVTTESDFTTVEETSNGYFEDVKLEGKTLVNLCKQNTLKNQGMKATTYDSSSHTYTATIGADNYPSLRLDLAQNIDISKIYTVYYKAKSTLQNKTVRVGICSDNGGTAWNVLGEYRKLNTTYTAYMEKLTFYGEKHICLGFGFGTNTSSQWEDVVIDIKDVLVLEGDHTNNPPEYFEGLKSVGDGADEISVDSFTGIDLDLEVGTISAEGYLATASNRYRTVDFIKNITGYVDIFKFDSNVYRYSVRQYDENKEIIQNTVQWETGKFKLLDNCAYFKLVLSRIDDSIFDKPNLSLYGKPQSDKKRLLYYNNETQAWEKPILRQWDSIEKHSDGKYYYHKRSGEVVLNGSEDWKKDTGNKLGYIIFYMSGAIGKKNGVCLSDKFKYSPASYSNLAEECIKLNGTGVLCILINNTKLSTQDLAGFKAWLQTNNVTVVYQLAQEEVYECTNIDLITYANETNYIVNTGAIVPKSTLKVMCNINNVVRELQQKVSNLENYIQHVMIDALNNALNE